MWARFTSTDVRNILSYLGTLLVGFSFLFLVPFITGLVFQEWKPAANYLLGGGISAVLGCALRFTRVSNPRLNRQQAMAVTGLAWLVLAGVASVPLMLSGHFANPLDAMYDAVSGITTTGASVIEDLDHLSNADNMWRFALHALGGLGLIVVALSFGLFGGNVSSSLYSSEGRNEHVVPSIVDTARTIAKLSTVFIGIAALVMFAVLLYLGLSTERSFLHALWLSISGFATGGFSPMADSVMYYNSPVLEIVLMVLMVFGTINFALYNEFLHNRIAVLYKDLEIKTMVIWLAVITTVFAFALASSGNFHDIVAMIRRGLFMVVSAYSTSGFQTITANQLTTVFSSGALLVLAIFMAVGGGSGSTAGGLKLFRIGIMFKSISNTIKEALLPDSAKVATSYNHLGRKILTPKIAKEAMTIFVLFVITVGVGALAGIMHGYDATSSIFESLSMAGNGGITCGIVSPDMPKTLEVIYIIQMWAGRLEFITLLALVVQTVVSVIPDKHKKAKYND